MELQDLKGVGKHTLTLLHKLNIYSLKDLVFYFPFRYNDFKKTNYEDFQDGATILIEGVVCSVPTVFYIKPKLSKMMFQIQTEFGLFGIEIYNRDYLKKQLPIHTEVMVIGKLNQRRQVIVATDIRFGSLDRERIEGVYRTTYGLSKKQLQQYISQALESYVCEDSILPIEIQEKYHFQNRKQAILEVHRPTSLRNLDVALKQLKYEELFLFMLQMTALRETKHHKMGLKRNIPIERLENCIQSLPFALTIDQRKALSEIVDDLNRETRMNRLLQGDVGSGKTVVALLAMYANYLSGYQSALMAPTEILATQHYETIRKFLTPYGVRIGLLTGKMKAKEKKEFMTLLKENQLDIVVGTHALFQEQVSYANLGFVITDEQHRFGVNQRSNLKNKGITPDILYMSATPIPRTYALTIYGDMDVSNIRSMPSGRKQVITLLKKENEIRSVLEMMWQELQQHHQIYVIAPLIEESEKIDLENVNALQLKMHKAFGKYYQIGCLHGKMSSAEKDQVMLQFQNNEIQILISTTVIEVGVDCPNATMIVIFDSFRFGLSALHQLRGRVGRGALQSYCILIADHETDRLSILTKTNDGFQISEEDFLLRGSGDLFGNKQSGDMSFYLADLKKDYPILLKAKEDSEQFYRSSKYQENPFYKKMIEDCQTLG